MVSADLPLELPSFIGRERGLVVVEGLLSRARLVTLTGMGGFSKTRLVVQPEVASYDARYLFQKPMIDECLVDFPSEIRVPVW